jgi:4-hydroxysphinganine ceramide fatty acyl 2-hydroxylase
MRDFKIDNKGTTQLFRNRFLERLTRTHFIFPVILYYLVSFICIYFSARKTDISVFNHIWIFFAGMLLFSLVEYLIHRFLFHFDAKTDKELHLQYQIHGVHHEFPRDKDRLVMPPVLSVFIAGVFYLIFTLLFPVSGLILFAGFIAGYSSYLLIHYAVHARRPPNNFLKFWWKHHAKHHYSSVDTAFSVSMPLWDYLFRTVKKDS